MKAHYTDSFTLLIILNYFIDQFFPVLENEFDEYKNLEDRSSPLCYFIFFCWLASQNGKLFHNVRQLHIIGINDYIK